MEKRIALIGAGAVGSHLAVAFKEAGLPIMQIISRSAKEGQLLAEELDASFSTRPEDLMNGVTHILLTLPDNAIIEVIDRLPIQKSVIIHTSGSFPMIDLKRYGPDFGVLYPLQSITKSFKPVWKDVPFFLEASNRVVESDLLELLGKLGASSILLDSEKRKKLHLAAVFASNFTNHIQGIAQKMIKEIGLSEELIKPLVAETIRKSYNLGASEAQTGPAHRGDVDTIKKHLDLLSCCEMDRDIYRIMSNSIMKENKSK